MAEYRRYLCGMLAKNRSARRNFGPERPGQAEIRARPARPSPLKFAGRNGPAQFVKPEIYNPDIVQSFYKLLVRLRFNYC